VVEGWPRQLGLVWHTTWTLTEAVAYSWDERSAEGDATAPKTSGVMDGHMANFGEQLRQFRLRAGLSQAQLAERAHLSPAAVTTLERGVRNLPYPRTLDALAEALGLGARACRPGRRGPALGTLTADADALAGATSTAGSPAADLADLLCWARS
jgi:transcriptional regulator with XRE-family HTH domain